MAVIAARNLPRRSRRPQSTGRSLIILCDGSTDLEHNFVRAAVPVKKSSYDQLSPLARIEAYFGKLTKLRIPVDKIQHVLKADLIPWQESIKPFISNPEIRDIPVAANYKSFCGAGVASESNYSTSETVISLFYPPSPDPSLLRSFVLTPVLSWLIVHRRGEVMNYCKDRNLP